MTVFRGLTVARAKERITGMNLTYIQEEQDQEQNVLGNTKQQYEEK